MTDDLRAACARAVHVVTADGEVLRAGRATMFVLRALGYRRLGALGATPPFVWFVELGYRIVANNRRLFSRFMFRRE